jgi:hypothetical protein
MNTLNIWLSLLMLSLFSSTFAHNGMDYNSAWKEVARLESEGKIKEASSAVQQIIRAAHKHQQTDQSYKATLYDFKYRMILEEDSEEKLIAALCIMMANSTSDSEKALFELLLGDLYYQYYNNHVYELLDRTASANSGDDFRYWDARKFIHEIRQLYLSALSRSADLKSTPLEDVSEMVLGSKESKTLLPTLYDLLALKAFRFFSEQQPRIIQPRQSFSITDPRWFSSSNDFARLDFASEDTLSFNLLALTTLQRWTQERLSKEYLVLLSDIDRFRFRFVYEHYTGQDKDEIYEQALLRETDGAQTQEIKAMWQYQLADFWYAKSQEKKQGSKALVEIRQFCRDIILQFPGTEAALNGEALIKQMEQRELRFEMEEALPIGVPFKAFVHYRNLPQVQYRILELKEGQSFDRVQKVAEVWQQIKKSKLLRLGTFMLPGTEDLNAHAVELPFDQLPAGRYALVLFSGDIDKAPEDAVIHIAAFWVSNLSITAAQNTSGSYEVLVRDRITGRPIAGSAITVLLNQYNYTTRKQEANQHKALITNEQGAAKFDLGNGQGQQLSFVVRKGTDSYKSGSNYLYRNYPWETDDIWTNTTHVFTDRAIYRPGQTVFFKGLVIQRSGAKYRVAADIPASISLRDANYQVLNTDSYNTSEYGSFSGFFELPTGLLPGVYTLQSSNGSVSFRVEEYKRPNFEVNTDPVKGNFKLEDTVRITGKAVAYSGAGIAHATFSYTVKRTAWFPGWWAWYRRPGPQSSEQVIAQGTALTDASGTYSFSFVAHSEKGKFSGEDYYNYEIHVEVTDVNGETHARKSTIRAGRSSLNPGIETPSVWITGGPQNIHLSAKNLQDQSLNATFNLSLLPLRGPSNPLKARYWGVPDQFLLNSQEHAQRFPFDIYQDENDPMTWSQGPAIWEQKVAVNGDSTLHALPDNIRPGMYLLKALVSGENGDTLSIHRMIELRTEPGKSALPNWLNMTADQPRYKPGDTLHVVFSSSVPDAMVYFTFSQRDQVFLNGQDVMNHGRLEVKIPVTEKMLGGIHLNYHMLAQNRVLHETAFFEVPFDRLDKLSYEWKTFRNKLEPGADEKWELTIKGRHGEKVVAELLATLYDASLEAFVPHQFHFDLNMPVYGSQQPFNTLGSFRSQFSSVWQGERFHPVISFRVKEFPSLNTFGFEFGRYYPIYHTMKTSQRALATSPQATMKSETVEEGIGTVSFANGEQALADIIMPVDEGNGQETSVSTPVIFRKNFNETAFFFPSLKTDTAGHIVLSFNMPEALTKWKMLGLAHTKDLHYTLMQEEVVTSKDLMIVPNKMRFLRMGDELVLKARVSNLSDRPLEGLAHLRFRDAATNQLLDSVMLLSVSELDFYIRPGESAPVQWSFRVPVGLQGVLYEISATAGQFTDAETGEMPVLESRVLLTEALPVFVNRKGRYQFSLDKLKNAPSGSTLSKRLVFEYTSHPVWQAMMALPYLTEQKEESSSQIFNRFYANTLAAYILTQLPQSKVLLTTWKADGSLKSALEKNPELKSVVLEATPWLRDAPSETEQMHQLIRLFEAAENKFLQEQMLAQLKKLQTPNGGLSWFAGMPDNRYLTQYFLAGIGHLIQLGALDIQALPGLEDMLDRMILYADARTAEDFVEIKRRDSNYLQHEHLGWMSAHYLYVRSFFVDKKLSGAHREAFDFFLKQAEKYAVNRNVYAKGMLALALHRNGRKKAAEALTTTLQQTAISSQTEGMYWKEVVYGGYWYQAPVETQALMVEVFSEIAGDKNTVDALKTWLLRQKQTSRWASTRATAEACYALLLTGGSWTDDHVNDRVQVGKYSLTEMEAAPGTGYIKKTWDAKDVSSEMATVQITKKANNPSWGALYWQYWEDMDQVKSASNDLKIRRTVYQLVSTDIGEVLMPLSSETDLQVGHKLRIRLEIEADRDMEFVHISDSRGSGMEPVDVLSGYQQKGGLWSYQVTGDAATHWYIDRLNKGTYTLEYTVYGAAAGHFISGVSVGECLYAPEFRAHTVGSKIMIKP